MADRIRDKLRSLGAGVRRSSIGSSRHGARASCVALAVRLTLRKFFGRRSMRSAPQIFAHMYERIGCARLEGLRYFSPHAHLALVSGGADRTARGVSSTCRAQHHPCPRRQHNCSRTSAAVGSRSSGVQPTAESHDHRRE
jgi:hypothetical protein